MKLLAKEARKTKQYEGDDPAGLVRRYVWSGRPAEPEKGEESGGD